ncbi:hypothetical protein GCM10007853_23860 [Algimonas ampicilliniresistens]|uniref:Uncharacterized protein n=1 Tax=Algimonas ampicilliniresistens TaxID=1298735 RepID=A0ABQ5VC06_9PROT|nr:hypothetical protein GCM10007853_23860 [Algimonas ampicilliniresistens]
MACDIFSQNPHISDQFLFRRDQLSELGSNRIDGAESPANGTVRDDRLDVTTRHYGGALPPT